MQLSDIRLAIIGLGYVGLPLAVEFGRQRSVTGFDINRKRIEALKAGNDATLETSAEELEAAQHLHFTTDIEQLRGCNCYIVTVPTPIDAHKRPDLTPLLKAMTRKRMQVDGAKVLVMGLAFKENCHDLRNTRVVDIVNELREYNCEVDVHDPWVDVEEAMHEYGITTVVHPVVGRCDAIILAVVHQKLKDKGAVAIRNLGKPNSVMYDWKYLLTSRKADLRL